ncbi:hypothetical protein F4861DRAFT_543575 [Xylaria intraflava]|nr:hypothetical protein F4861DRAFT_543575 [Xylaria intraflava]
MSYGGDVNRGPFLNSINWVFGSIALEAISLWTWTFPKIPVARLLVRLFGTGKRYIAIILYSTVGLLVAWVTILTIVTFVQCSPIEKNWDPTVVGACWDPHIYLGLGYFAGAYSAVMDISFALYTAFQVSSLQMRRSRKIVIAVSLTKTWYPVGLPEVQVNSGRNIVLTLSYRASITTLYKLTTIAALTEAGDSTWATAPPGVWNSIESCTLIVAAGIPMSRPFLLLIEENIRRYVSQLSGGSSQNSKLYSGFRSKTKLSSKDGSRFSRILLGDTEGWSSSRFSG